MSFGASLDPAQLETQSVNRVLHTTAENKESDSKADEESAESAKGKADTEMKDAEATDPPAGDADAAEASAIGDDSVVPDDVATPSGDKSKNRRKSGAGSEPKGKKLNKKASKAKLLHLEAQPGDHFLVKLKGHPLWPVIVADEDMLPEVLIQSRPVSAKRADGSYREDFADGAKRANDRTFPVMYLRTREL